MPRFLVFLLALIFIQPAWSQKLNDVVYLHNGSILRGTLTEQNDTLVKIMTCCGNVFAFAAADVSRITREKTMRNQVLMTRKGYMNFTTFGVLVGSSDDPKPAPFSALTEHNYRFNKWIALGGLVGFEQLNENIMPVGINTKIFFTDDWIDYFIAGTGGYSISLGKPDEPGMEKATGGVMAGAETGIIIPVSQGSALILAIGYRYNVLNYQLNDWWRGDYKQQNTYNRLTIRIGISLF